MPKAAESYAQSRARHHKHRASPLLLHHKTCFKHYDRMLHTIAANCMLLGEIAVLKKLQWFYHNN